MGNKASHFKNKECEYFKKMFLAYLEIGKCYEDSGDCQAAYGYYLMGLRILVEVEKTATRMNVHNLSEIKQARREHVQFLKKMIDEKGVTNPFGRTPNLRNTDKYEPVSESYLSNFHARIKMAKRNMRMKDKKVLQSITSCILMKRPTTTWDNIIGLEREKEALQERLQDFSSTEYKKLVQLGRAEDRTGAILFGPPGCSKTKIMHACANAVGEGVTVFQLTSDALKSKWVGESEKFVAGIFQMAFELKPSLILVDEAEALFRDRSLPSQSDTQNAILTNLLTWITDVTGIFILASTNKPNTIDSGMMRRLELPIYVRLPNFEERKAILKHMLETTYHALLEGDIQLIARKTEGYSGSDLFNVIAEAKSRSIKMSKKSMNVVKRKTGTFYPVGDREDINFESNDIVERLSVSGATMEPRPLTLRDIALVGLQFIKASVTKQDIEDAESFAKKKGLMGNMAKEQNMATLIKNM